jgi:hypothetical protein
MKYFTTLVSDFSRFPCTANSRTNWEKKESDKDGALIIIV